MQADASHFRIKISLTLVILIHGSKRQCKMFKEKISRIFDVSLYIPGLENESRGREKKRVQAAHVIHFCFSLNH